MFLAVQLVHAAPSTDSTIGHDVQLVTQSQWETERGKRGGRTRQPYDDIIVGGMPATHVSLVVWNEPNDWPTAIVDTPSGRRPQTGLVV